MSCCESAPRAALRRILAAGTALLALTLGIALAGCGFRPLYSEEHYYTVPELASIKINPIADRRGQQLRNLLYTNLNPKGVPAKPLYALDTTLTAVKQDLAIAKDETVTRANYIVNAQFALRSLETGKVLFNSQSRSTTSFDVVESEYANVAAEKDAEERAIRAIGDDMTLRLSFYFTQKRSAAAQPAAPAAAPSNAAGNSGGAYPPGYPPSAYPPTYSPPPPGYAPQPGYPPLAYPPASYPAASYPAASYPAASYPPASYPNSYPAPAPPPAATP